MTHDFSLLPGGASARPGALDAEVHLATQQMLEEALAYMLRLPHHPLTAQLATKVQRHLSDPLTRAVEQRAQSDAQAQQAHRQNRSASLRHTTNGLPVLAVSVGKDDVQVCSEAARVYGSSSQGRKFALRLAAELANGVTMPLKTHKSS